jgi:hypothetical protein
VTDFKSLLTAVTTALGAISAAGNLPGVNLIPYVSTVASVAGLLQFALEKGINVASDIAALKDTFSNGLPSQDKIDALNARIAVLRAKLHAPLPPKEDGEDE